MRRRVLAGLIAGMLAVAGFAGTASARSGTEVYSFSNCTGPNVPSSFTATKIRLPDSALHGIAAASAFHVEGSAAVYTIYDFGSGAPHGIGVSGVATDWCWVGFLGQGLTLVGGAYHA